MSDGTGTEANGGASTDGDREPRDLRSDGGHAEDHHGLPPMSSVKRWFVTTNHKDIGILYLVTSLFFVVFGGLLALLIRTQMWTPGGTILSPQAYNQTVSIHGLVMVFWFLSPFAFGFANYVVPLQIGADDLAFPRLNALSYWLYLASGLLVGVSFFQGATFSGGWTMYAPLNVPMYMPEVGASTAVLALLLFVVSVTVSSVNFLTTMHRMRAEGLTLRRLPLFTWSILLTVWMMLFAFAALLAALMILSADRLLGTMYFVTESPGGSMLWTHLFWFFGHPEVYIVFFPALGVMAEIFQTFTGSRLIGRKWFIASMVLVALQSFIVWMHHMFLTTINLQIKTLFMATTIGISLPFDLMVFALIYTMLKGRIRFKTPFLFAFGGLIVFIVGGITGVFLGAVVLDYAMRGTYWVVAHFHYVMVAGVTALIGGLYYWFPKMTGRMYDEFLGKVQFGLYFLGFNLLYFPMFVAWETPRRVFDYPAELVGWHRIATVGGFLLGISFLVMFYNLYTSIWNGEEVDGNPWDFTHTAEWAVSSPPPLENFPGRATYKGGFLDFVDRVTTDGGEETSEGYRSPLSADGTGTRSDGGTSTGAPDGGVVTGGTGLPAQRDEGGGEMAVAHGEGPSHASIWPFATGVGAFVLLVGLSGFQSGAFPDGVAGGFYMGTSLAGGLITLGSLFAMGYEDFHAPEMAIAERWPFAGVENTKLGVWIFLASDVVLFGAFIGAYVFVRFSAGWTGWHIVPHNSLPGLINTYLLLTSSFTVILGMVAAEHESRKGLLACLTATLLLGIGFLINKGIEWVELLHEGIWLDASIEGATFFLTTGLHGAHVLAGLVITVYLMWRTWGGAYMGDEKPVEYFGLYWHFVDIVWLFLFPLFYIL
ncbi:cbb3-type cytochrome c oxidase subunit I [Salinirubellus sp. GCM10025818]|uniref:cbb3-type cytochrome c oxidase subunit I n=1 Tax=Salinirubellus TaxID=2162630 RepID=UPI00361C9D9D